MSLPVSLAGHPAFLAAPVVCAVMIVALVFWWSARKAPRYRQTPIMTNNELEFFGRLQRALPECYVFPQIAMSALITPLTKGRRWQTDFMRISQKRVDWALYAKAGLRLVAIIELDDATHDKDKDAARDKLTGSAGIRTLRFESRSKPHENEIRRICLRLLSKN